MIKERLESAATAILVVCALLMTSLAARREWGPQAAAPPPTSRTPSYFADWMSFEAVGRRLGTSSAPVTVTEFIDYECPACRQLDPILRRVLTDFDKQRPGQVSTVFVHFPLSMHRFASQAAQAVECAAAQARFHEMHALVLAKQDSFGLKPWTRYATEAHVSDSLSFANCLSDPMITAKVREGLALAERLKLQGTPTVLVNGWELTLGGPTVESDLRTAIERALKGKPAVDTSRKS
jgi:protein-disulfide isomerase